MVTQRKTTLYTVVSYGRSDVGMVRENNEDAWIVSPPDNVFILADGMGGHSAGEVAAHETVTNLALLVKKEFKFEDLTIDLKKSGEKLSKLVQEVNRIVHQIGKKDLELRGMGTTVCCVCFHPDGFVHAHVGDSRIYLMRKNKLRRLTEDHSLVEELLELGELNHRQAREYAYRHIITKAIGTEPEVTPAVNACDLEIGDLVLMCSDGLSDVLSQDQIEKVMNTEKSIVEVVDRLIDLANTKSGHDNTTIVLMKANQKGDERTNLS